MILNFNVNVKAGPRTPAEVVCYYTAVNKKTLTLINGETISNDQIAQWIRNELQEALDKLQGGNQ